MAGALIEPRAGFARADRDDRIEQLVRNGAGAGAKVLDGPVWLTVLPHRPAQLLAHGWKLHISCSASTFPALVAAVLPVLADEGCAFKLARSQPVLGELNDGITSPASVGKAFTIYPDQDRVRDLGIRLADLLAGYQGPRVLSDRRVSGSAPVYYRYGPFIASPIANARGEVASWLHGPDGQRFEAVATLRYEQPPWVLDPFTGEGSDRTRAALPLVGGRYQVVAGIRESARGNVFRAIDQRDGATVILKQARALVSEDHDRVDTRLRLRNERRIYQVLDGMPGVPRFIDHFRHGDDEFLVCSDCGPRTLTEDVLRHGPYRLNPGRDGREGRGLGHLARQLARIVSDIHDRGVIIRDLAPSNIVVQAGQVHLIDFGLAGYEALHLGGGTPGYAPARQLRDETPLDVDDLYALGMTLLFAATRLHPVTIGDDDDLPLARALQLIHARYRPGRTGVIAAITDLLGGGEQARRALRKLAAGQPYRPAGPPAALPAAALPAAVAVTSDLVQEIRDSLRAELEAQVDEILGAGDDTHEAHDASLYTGSAGVGLELLQHAEHGEVADRLEQLVTFTAQAVRRVHLPPGLYTGRTGADLFVGQALKLGVGSAIEFAGAAVPPADFRPEGDDLIVGAAGVGLGHLALFRLTGDQQHLAVSRRCVSLLMNRARPESSFGDNPDPENAVEPTAGRAHGLAGTTELLVSFAEQSGDHAVTEAAAASTRLLSDQARDLIRRSGDAGASPLAASWCQGLTGIGQTLLHAGAVLGNPGLSSLARQCSHACLALVPRIGTLGQCCGAAGVGNFLIDLAIADDTDRYLAAAYDVAEHLLRRSAGPANRPVFTESGQDNFASSWANGVTGILTFFRRLAAQGGPDIVPIRPDLSPLSRSQCPPA
jgi:tRNA A-37 threonylcarbamoyl transferase component Bud32